MMRVTVIGRLAVDPDTKKVGNSTVTSFRLAANGTHKNADGSYPTSFFSVAVWGKMGEQCAKFLHKGDRCAVSGDLHMHQYSKKSGEIGFDAAIENASVEFLNNKPKSNDDDDRPPF